MSLKNTWHIPLVIFTFCLLLVPFPSLGTHLIGGNLGYEDLGQDPFNSNNRVYRIYF